MAPEFPGPLIRHPNKIPKTEARFASNEAEAMSKNHGG
jgi:hypothetical protein